METEEAVATQGDRTLQLLVRQIRFEGKGINSYKLVDPNGGDLPDFGAGAHIDIHLGDGLIRQYSLCNDPAERQHCVIAVLRDEHLLLQVRIRVIDGGLRQDFERWYPGFTANDATLQLSARPHQIERSRLTSSGGTFASTTASCS
jgi:hypothetical protein